MSASASTPCTLFVGVDIAAKTFVACWQPDLKPLPTRSFPQTPAGWSDFQQALLATGNPADRCLVAMEATGSYWVALAVQLHQGGFVVSVVNPAQLHDWAKSLPRRSKTDRLDAQLLALFARERCPATWTPPPAIYYELHQRLVARDGLMQMRGQAANQLHALKQWPVVIAAVSEQLQAVISNLDQQIKLLDKAITTLLRDGAWRSSVLLLQTIPGLGLHTIAWLLVATLNFRNTLNAAAVVSYAGLSPLQQESGTSVHGRAELGRGGHRRLRQALYMATLSAAQHNPLIKGLYQRLRAAGKPMKVARCAAARKLLVLAYTIVTKQQAFDPFHQQPAAKAA